MDPRLDENEAEFGVPVLSVPLEVLADGDGLNTAVSGQNSQRVGVS